MRTHVRHRLQAVSLIFVALVTPFEVGFLESAASALEPLFILNRIIDAIFIIDCVLQFFLIVPIDYGTQGTHWIHDPTLIAIHYFKGWFMIDFASIGISAIDFVSLGSDQSGTSIEDLRMLRVLRTLRLIKLAKLLTGLKLIKKYETQFAINYGAVSLGKCCFGMLLLSHWFACIWGLQAGFAENPLDTWLGGNGEYCVADATSNTNFRCKAPGQIYAASVYWAVMTITSIGYGDIAATPGNTSEQVVCTILMILGAMGWGLVLGTIVQNLSNLDPEGDQFTSTMGELNRMMNLEGLPKEMRIRLREYFQQTLHIRRTERRRQLLQLMSPSLQSEVAWQVSKLWLEQVWFLRGAPVAFMVQLAMRLSPQVFAPAEIAPIGDLYIVSRGLALYGGKVYGQGKLWGEDMILTTEHLKIKYNARAMVFLDVFTIAREELEEVAEMYPSVKKQLRFYVVRMATRRSIIYEAYKRRRAAGEDFGPAGMPFLEEREEALLIKRPRNSNDNWEGSFSTGPPQRPMLHVAPQSPKVGWQNSTSSAGGPAIAFNGIGSSPSIQLPSASPFQRAVELILPLRADAQAQPDTHQVVAASVTAMGASIEAKLAPMLETIISGQKRIASDQRRISNDMKVQQVGDGPTPCTQPRAKYTLTNLMLALTPTVYRSKRKCSAVICGTCKV